jgi:tRNA pseudouridine38-40 synthase
VLIGPGYELRVAGRTDAGVHATGQVVSVATTSDRPSERVLRGLEGLLPDDVAVRAVAEAPPGFDARADATSRAYDYRILRGAPSPLRRRRTLRIAGPLDLAGLRASAALVEGRHDFRAFTPTRTEHVFFDRTVLRCVWEERGDELVLAIEADAFLRHMVRVLVGTMLLVGRGTWEPGRLGGLLSGAPRSAAGPTAPAHPLALVAVRYPPSPGLAAATGVASSPEAG